MWRGEGRSIDRNKLFRSPLPTSPQLLNSSQLSSLSGRRASFPFLSVRGILLVSTPEFVMSGSRQCNPEFLTEFIELYKNCPCLWQIKSKEYRDRNRKNQAYEQLIQKFKEVDSTANRETVAKKINSLRTVYKKELIKVRKSEVSGDVYSPTLWYYNLFSFLDDQESPRTPRQMFDVKEEPFTVMDQESADYEYSEDQELGDSASNPEENMICQYSASSAQCLWGSRKRKGSEDQDVMDRAERRLESVASEDSFDRYGKHIADRLRQIKPHQIKFIQKLVSDVLFEGELEALNKNWKLMETRPAESQSLTSSQQTVKPDSLEFD